MSAFSWQLGAEINIPWYGQPGREYMFAPWRFAQAVCFYASGEGFAQCPQAATGPCAVSALMRYGVLPALSWLPLLLRLAQCLRMYGATRKRWPHLANGTKYGLALCIVVLGSTHSEWRSAA